MLQPLELVRLDGFELRRVRLPLVTPWATAYGTINERQSLLVRAAGPDTEGWGECVALNAPDYTAEYRDGAAEVLRRFLVPALPVTGMRPDGIGPALAGIRGHPMAKAALELAVLDAALRAAGTPLARHLGATRETVPAGVSVGIVRPIGRLLDAVAGYVAAGYVRVKLKIAPGWDVEPVGAVRERFGDGLILQVDANGAYRQEDAGHLAALDPFGLALIEQPLDEDDLAGHADLARRIATPVCLDESITSVATAVRAIEAGACAVVNLKAGRVGGLLEAVRIHDACVERRVPVWCGGMLETGVGRAANVALAALPGFTLPGDLSASDRYFAADVTPPFVLEGGHLAVPRGPGLGVTPDPAALDAVTESTEWVPLT